MKYLFFLLAACTSIPKTPVEKRIPISAGTLQREKISHYLQGYGLLAPEALVELRAQVSGHILNLHFIEGQKVKKGDLLAEIDPTLYRLKLQEMEAMLRQKLIQKEFAHKKWERYRSVKKDHLAAIELDQLEQELKLIEAHIQADEARVQRALIDVENCSLRAPISGRIGKWMVQKENWVSVGTHMASIAASKKLYLDFHILEQDLSSVPPKAPIEIRFKQEDPWLPSGTLFATDHVVDQETGSIKARGLIDKASHNLWPGQLVEWRLLLSEQEACPLLPMEAIVHNQKGSFVYVVKEEGMVELRQIHLKETKGRFAVLESGLYDTEIVVLRGRERLRPGAFVEIIP